VPPFPANFSWTSYLSRARALLAAVALTGTYFRQPGATPVYYGLLVLFLIYALGAAVRKPAGNGIFGLLALFADTVFFLILASHGTERSLWLASIFYLFLLAEAMVRHSPREVLLVAVVAAIFGAAMPASAVSLLERTVVVGGVVAFACAINQQRLKHTVEKLEADLAAASKAPEIAVETERLRIASDFHDGPLQNFISMQMRLDILGKLLDRDQQAGLEDLRQLQDIAREQVRELRSFLRSMRPLEVDGSNIFASARRTAETFQKDTGIPVTFIGGNSPTPLAPEVAQEVLQMLQESLHNIQKHASATRVAVAIERNDRTLEISVDDNGRGFNFVGTYSLEELELLKLGPASLKRRARSLNADLVLESRPGRGSGLRFRIPMQ
jgi:signal transduction histidine kinase